LKVTVTQSSSSKQIAGIKRKVLVSSKKIECEKGTSNKEDREENATKCMASLKRKAYRPIYTDAILNMELMRV